MTSSRGRAGSGSSSGDGGRFARTVRATGESPETAGPAPGRRVARPGQIRRLGPFVALLLPAALLVAGALFFAIPCEKTACVKPALITYLLVLLALPTALLAGLPWFLHPPNIGFAILTSLVLWLCFGRWAAKRATEDVDATWRTYAGELAFMVGGVWGGIVVGLLVVGLWLSH